MQLLKRRQSVSEWRGQTWLGQRSACFMREGLCVPTCWMAISRVIALVCASPGAAMSTSRAAKKNTATLHQQHHRFIVIKFLASRHRHMWEGMPSHLTANNAEPTRVEIASVSRRACAHWNFHHWGTTFFLYSMAATRVRLMHTKRSPRQAIYALAQTQQLYGMDLESATHTHFC